MAVDRSLLLYQEILLLALRDDRGTAERGIWATQAVGAGVLADLVLAERVTLEGKKALVTVLDDTPTADPVLDAALAQMAGAKRRANAQRWVGKLAVKKVFHAAAERLCELGVLRIESQSVLLFFSQRVYPEIDPGPEREVVDRLREAIFTDRTDIDAPTSVLVSIASATELLKAHFPKKDLRARKKRIEIIKSGDAVGEAAAKVIQGIQAAVIVACVTPAIAAAG